MSSVGIVNSKFPEELVVLMEGICQRRVRVLRSMLQVPSTDWMDGGVMPLLFN